MKKLIALLILLAACTKSEAPMAAADTASASIAQPAARVKGAPEQQQQQLTRMIVRTADVRIIVKDTATAVNAISQNVEAGGGFVSDSSIWREGELLRARLTLRVPSAQLTSTLASIRKTAKRVENESIRSEDVTQEYVDLESQLRNLEATEKELRALLVTIRQNAKKAAEVLEVHQQLVNIRGEIERTKGRLLFLGRQTALATIALDITPDAIAQPVVKAGWQPLVIVKDASRALIVALQKFATAAIWTLIYILPVFGIFALMALMLRRVYRRARPA
jgi:Domain of unknown function (DUF4349)